MGETTTDLQAILDRIDRGDARAWDELIDRAYHRLRRLAGTIFHQSFPALADRHELDSVLSETWFRLRQALEAARPASVPDFYRLAAHKIRHVLLDMAERQRLRDRREGGPAGPDPGGQADDPARLQQWTEFHQAVAALPEAEREVVELRFYAGLTNEEIARVLGLHPRKVSYLWVGAAERLADRCALPE